MKSNSHRDTKVTNAIYSGRRAVVAGFVKNVAKCGELRRETTQEINNYKRHNNSPANALGVRETILRLHRTSKYLTLKGGGEGSPVPNEPILIFALRANLRIHEVKTKFYCYEATNNRQVLIERRTRASNHPRNRKFFYLMVAVRANN